MTSPSSQQISTQIKLLESHLQGFIDFLTFLHSQRRRNFLDSLSSIKLSLYKSFQELESKQFAIENRENELKLRENKLNSTENELRLREKKLYSTENFVCVRCKTLGVKVSEIGNVVVKIEPSSEIIDIDDGKCDGDASVKLIVTMDGKSLQMFLNDKFDVHEFIGEEVKSAVKLSSNPAKLVLDAMEGFLPPLLKKGKLEYEGNVVRSSCVVLLEQLMELKPRIKKAVTEEARALADEWWEKVKAERGDYMVVLGFLLLVVVYDVWSDFNKIELWSLAEVVQNHRVVGELHSRIFFLRKCGVNSTAPTVQKGEPYSCTAPVKSSVASPLQKEGPYNPTVKFSMAPPVQKEEHYTSSIMNTSVSPSTESSVDLDTFCTNITATGLKSYLIKNVKDLMSLDEKVVECLQYASDPAKIVFDVVQDFYLELDGIQGDTNMSCCVFLLEQLMVVSPHITTLLKEEILNFAARWKARLAMTSTKPIVVFGFLKFLVAYKLSGSFQADEILTLFTVLYERDDVYKSEQISMLCRALGLEEKIPELVQSLIQENKQLEAVRYICGFKLADKFPPSLLLKEYLDHTKETAFEMCKNVDNSIKAQNKSARRQIRALQSVLKCIFEFKLDFECSPIDLQQQIRQLEQEKEQRKSLKPEKDKTGKKKNSAPNRPGFWSDFTTPKIRVVLPTVTQSQPLQGHSQEKRPRIDTAQNSGLTNLFTPIDFNLDLSLPSSRSP